ncbi:MAG TPA: chromate transporter [Steroidobacteraceae bacterium]|nr:chromate transporter [Steroidobacteraceae bacterium]
MSESGPSAIPTESRTAIAASPNGVSTAQIFREFLLIGATSFGGGVVAYLRNGLVTRRQWVDDKEFVELLSISQTLPGLNATNMAILVGDRLRGAMGALAAICGICLPGAALMYLVAMVYAAHGDHPLATAALKGVAAAAVGLVLATCVQLGKKSLSNTYDLIFVALTVLGVNRLHQSVLTVLAVVGIVAILWYRPKKTPDKRATSWTK